MNFEHILTGKAFLYGFLLWLIPFIVGFFTFPIKTKWPLVFKTVMAVVLVAATVGLSHSYLIQAQNIDAVQGLLLGCLWAIICIVIDIPVFILGFKMRACAYFGEIGIAYLVVPMIVWGNGSLIEALAHRVAL